mgnify:CR=1 FL=1
MTRTVIGKNITSCGPDFTRLSSDPEDDLLVADVNTFAELLLCAREDFFESAAENTLLLLLWYRLDEL